MTTVSIAPNPILQFFNNIGAPNAGGSVLTQVGGVNYPTYQDSAGTIPLPNPIPLNSRGEISNASGVSCQLFLVAGATYVFTLYDVNGNQLNQATYVGSGSANIPYGTATDISDVYTVTIVTGIGFSLATADGGIISVTIPTANTTITPHLNATLGSLVFSSQLIYVWRGGVAVAPIIGEIQGRCLFQWDNANTRWILLNSDVSSSSTTATTATNLLGGTVQATQVGFETGAGVGASASGAFGTTITLNNMTGHLTVTGFPALNNLTDYGCCNFSNSSIGANDIVIATPTNALSVLVFCDTVTAGMAYMRIFNKSGGTISAGQSVAFNFAIIKGSVN